MCVCVCVSERIARIRVKLQFSFATIIAVYYSKRQSTIASIPHKDMVIVLGDFNARVGQSSPHCKSIVGPFTSDNTNENGSHLLDFCMSNNLIISNTWFQHKSIHSTTWYRNGDRSRTGHMLDYVLVSRGFRSSVLDTRVYRSTYLESDHELVVSTLHSKIRAKRRQPRHGPRYQTHQLPSNCADAFKSVLSSSFDLFFQQSREQPDDVELVWSGFKSAIEEASKSLPILPDNKPAEWMTDELLNLSRKKRDAWMLLRNKDPKTNNPKLQEEYKRLCKLTKVAAEKARNAWWSERAAEAEKRAWFTEQLGQGGSFLKELRLLKRQVSRPAVTPLIAKDSSPITDDEGKLRRWAEHFTEVVNCEALVSEAALDILPVIIVVQTVVTMIVILIWVLPHQKKKSPWRFPN